MSKNTSVSDEQIVPSGEALSVVSPGNMPHAHVVNVFLSGDQ
jgi:hypothetical protein